MYVFIQQRLIESVPSVKHSARYWDLRVNEKQIVLDLLELMV